MTAEEANHILGLPKGETDEDAIREAYEDTLFQEAGFFMKRVFLPALAIARIKNLKRLRKAEETFKLEFSTRRFAPDPLEYCGNFPELISAYNRREAKLKLFLSHASSAEEAIDAYERWLELFNTYSENFFKIFEKEASSFSGDANGKLSKSEIYTELNQCEEGSSRYRELIRNEQARLKKLRQKNE